MRRTLVILAAVGAVFAVTASQALAYDCVVANKPTGAGSAGAVTVDVIAGTVTPTGSNKPNPGSLETGLHGGFATVTLEANGTTLAGPVDTFVHGPANAQAPFAEEHVIPGAIVQESKEDKGCDGKGLDTIEACGL